MIPDHPLGYHYPPSFLSEKIALFLVKFLANLADLFFGERYGHRSLFVETVAGIPGMVGGALLHFRCLRKIKKDEGWIRHLLDEAERERMHLMVLVEIVKPRLIERFFIYVAQIFFIGFYSILYGCSSRLAHRFVGYLEEEAIQTYSDYLEKVLSGSMPNVVAPPLGIAYWNLKKNAHLSDLIEAIREDERRHRDTNHHFADQLT